MFLRSLVSQFFFLHDHCTFFLLSHSAHVPTGTIIIFTDDVLQIEIRIRLNFSFSLVSLHIHCPAPNAASHVASRVSRAGKADDGESASSEMLLNTFVDSIS